MTGKTFQWDRKKDQHILGSHTAHAAESDKKNLKCFFKKLFVYQLQYELLIFCGFQQTCYLVGYFFAAKDIQQHDTVLDFPIRFAFSGKRFLCHLNVLTIFAA